MATLLILAVLGSIGVIAVCAALWLLIRAIRRHPYLLRISGTVATVERQRKTGGDSVTFYPIISYTTPEGKQVRFRSNIGTTLPVRQIGGGPISPWRDGQSIDIFHDPSGYLSPCIASLWGLYGTGACVLIGGILVLIVVANKWSQLGGH